MKTLTETALPEVWSVDAVTELVLRLRRVGVPAYQGSVRPDGSMQFSFEYEAIGRKLAVETVLLAWPGAAIVRHVAPGLVRVYGQQHQEPDRQPERWRWRWPRRG